MTSASHLFKTRQEMEEEGWELTGNVFERDGEKYLPLYEAKMIHLFDHRWATYEPDGSIRKVTPAEKKNPDFAPMPRYWVPEWEVIKRGSQVSNKLIKAYDNEDEEKLTIEMKKELGEEFEGYVTGDIFSAAEKVIEERCPKWFLGWRDITNSTNERTVIFSSIPRSGIGHTAPIMYVENDKKDFLYANLNSLVLDYIARLKVGGTHLTYGYLKQFAVFPPYNVQEKTKLIAIIEHEIDELKTYQDEFQIFQVRCKMDAAFFHLYGIERNDVDYIMDTFPITKRKEIEAYGEYRTKKTILEMYDAMYRLFHDTWNKHHEDKNKF